MCGIYFPTILSNAPITQLSRGHLHNKFQLFLQDNKKLFDRNIIFPNSKVICEAFSFFSKLHINFKISVLSH